MYHYDDENDNNDIDVSQNEWSTVKVNAGMPPAPRSLHTATVLNNTFYTFGGYDGVARVNTFHAFSFAEKRWTPVLPSANSSRAPSPRDRHVCTAFGYVTIISKRKQMKPHRCHCCCYCGCSYYS